MADALRGAQGAPALIGYLVDKLNREEGLGLTHGNLMIVAGSTAAVDMLARLYAGHGSVVLVKAPSYHDALHIFRDHGCDLCPVPIDDDALYSTTASSSRRWRPNLPRSVKRGNRSSCSMPFPTFRIQPG